MSTTRKALFTLAALSLAAFAAHPASAQSLITNGSFEANSFTTYPGYVGGDNGFITGWTSNNNNSGLNPAAGDPFDNNGVSPDGGNVAFLQSAGGSTATPTTLYQQLTGLTIGQVYSVSFYDNSRANTAIPTLSLLVGGTQSNVPAGPGQTTIIGGTSIYSSAITPVGGTNPYNFITTSFTANAASEYLEFSAVSSTPGGDATALIDGVNASAAPEPSQIGMLALVALGLGALAVKARRRSTAARTA